MIEDHKPGNDPLKVDAPPDDADDAVVIWGKRVGRILGVAFAIFLIWQLLATYVFKSA